PARSDTHPPAAAAAPIDSPALRRSKGPFFRQLGLSVEQPEALLAELAKVAWTCEVVDQVLGPYGIRYVIDKDTFGKLGQARLPSCACLLFTIQYKPCATHSQTWAAFSAIGARSCSRRREGILA